MQTSIRNVPAMRSEEAAECWGTIARMKLRPEVPEEYLSAQMRALNPDRAGWVNSAFYRSDEDPREFWLVVMFEDKESYRANAESSAQHSVYLTFRACLEDDPDGTAFTAFCVELGTASCGDTEDEALKNIAEAITLHLNTLEDLGQRDRVFRQAGIEIEETRPPRVRDEDHAFEWGPTEVATRRSMQVAYA